jgi:CRISPR-associated protein Cas5d
MKGTVHSIEVWGELACFSRPELKVERYSYPVITPSAARAIFDAIYRKPRFRWQVNLIEILAVPRYIALRRNEVKDKVPSEKVILRWASGKDQAEPIWADGDNSSLGTDQKGRTQRQTMALKNVRYRITAQIVPWSGNEQDLAGFDRQFLRHASKGQCLYQPYLGCREFPAYFRLVETGEQTDAPASIDLNLGYMLYDVFDLSRPGTADDPPFVSLFQAVVSRGVLNVPAFESPAVRKPAQGKSVC